MTDSLMPYSFGKNHRLLSAPEFSKVFSENTSRAACPEILMLARSNNLPESRIGFVISKKNVKKAVQRNLIKRVIREYFRLNNGFSSSCDIVILARKGADQLDARTIRGISRKLFNRIDRRLENTQ